MKAVADNDVLLKGTCYVLMPQIAAAVPGIGATGVLGSSRYIVPREIQRRCTRDIATRAEECFAAFLRENELLEPDSAEQAMAVRLERRAQDLGLNLDAGESQLLAIAISRGSPWVLTGDKRAIISIEILLDHEPCLAPVQRRVWCLEALVREVLFAGDTREIRSSICRVEEADRALSICFKCGRTPPTREEALEGLLSYITHLRSGAPRVLFA